MAYNSTTGVWDPESADVGKQVTGLLSKGGDYMKAATAGATKAANRRGLINSSISAGAGVDAAIKSALPIASQNAQQIHQQNLQTGQFGHEAGQLGKQIESTEKMGFANIAAHDREKTLAGLAAFENSYGEIFRTIGQNEALPAAVRDKYLAQAAKMRDSNMNLVSQLYGVELDWEA
jgi:hypothetical protein